MDILKQQKNLPMSEDVLVALRKIIQYIDMHSRFLVKQIGLTGPQLIILREISKSKGLSITHIAGAISLSQATVTGILDRLERRGLVIRQRSQKDRRQTILETTPAGDALLEQFPPVMQESFLESFDCLEDWEKAMILSSLQRLVAMMDTKRMKAASMPITAGSCREGVNSASANTGPQKTKPADSDSNGYSDESSLFLVT